jgi:hypothetical protein
MSARVEAALRDAARQTIKLAALGLALAALVALVMHLYSAMSRQCAVCGESILLGSYYAEPEFGDVYHLQHKQIDRCAFCGRILSPYSSAGPGIVKSDGRSMCPICHQDAVVTWDEAATLAQGVRTRMKSWGIAFNSQQVPIQLVDEVTLLRIKQTEGLLDGTLEGLTHYFGDSQGRMSTEIFVLSGLPKIRCRWVIAHELMHAWLIQRHAPPHKPRLEEGAAELAAYRLLSSHPGPAERRELRIEFANSDPIYGGGLRQAAAYERAHGFPAFLSLLATHADFPTKLIKHGAGNSPPTRRTL